MDWRAVYGPEVTADVCCMTTEAAAKYLYDRCQAVKPSWAQLGDVTRSVWIERAAEVQAGDLV